MMYWFLVFIIPIILLAFVEEGIYFLVNRNVFGVSRFERKIRDWISGWKKPVVDNQPKASGE